MKQVIKFIVRAFNEGRRTIPPKQHWR
jgi:hypothetical protein